MKQLIHPFIILTAAVVMLAACRKDEVSTSLDAAPGVYFVYRQNNQNIDSVTYTFVEKSSTTLKDTLWMPVRISGNTADRERAIALAPVTGSTAVKDVHYKLLSYSMPKGAFQTQLGIVLLRDASLRDTSVVLKLRLQPTADFTTPMKDTVMGDGNYVSRNEVKIIFTDRLLKPSNWESYLTTFFGAYSNVKFRFIASVLGISSFSTTGPNAVNFPRMQFYQNTVRNALLEYNATHPPLIDENGNTVVIP